MPVNRPKVGIVYLSYHSEAYMDDVITGMKRLNYPKDQLEFIIVDNTHPEFGSSARYLEDMVMPYSEKELPRTTLLIQNDNLGYTGGNNIGIQWAIDHGCQYVYLHNQDGFMDPDCIVKLVEAMESDSKIGVAQSLLVLHPDTDKINSSGNSYHYLGFGYVQNYGLPKNQLQIPSVVVPIGYASGASMLMRSDLLKTYGFLDNDLFLYHEDVEYSLRLKAVGYTAVLARDSVFYHKYSFGRNATKFYFMERNRYAVVLMYYSWLTMLLLLPMALIMELGLIFFYARQKMLGTRLRVYGYWLKPSSWKLWLKKRKHIQAIKKVDDTIFLKDVVTGINFGTKEINSPLLRYVANPIMAVYWAVIKFLIP